MKGFLCLSETKGFLCLKDEGCFFVCDRQRVFFFFARFSLSLAHTRDVVSLCPRAAEGAKGSAVRRLIQDADGFRTS